MEDINGKGIFKTKSNNYCRDQYARLQIKLKTDYKRIFKDTTFKNTVPDCFNRENEVEKRL